MIFPALTKGGEAGGCTDLNLDHGFRGNQMGEDEAEGSISRGEGRKNETGATRLEVSCFRLSKPARPGLITMLPCKGSWRVSKGPVRRSKRQGENQFGTREA